MTFNRADAQVRRTPGGRIQIVNNVQQRLDTVLSVLKRRSKSATLVPMYEIVGDVQKKDTTHTYSYSDVVYALKRLMSAGLVSNPAWGVYSLTLDPKVVNVRMRRTR